MAEQPSFSERAIEVILERCPELADDTLIIDRFAHDDLRQAIDAALSRVPPALARAINAQLDELYPEEFDRADKHFGNGGAFSFPLDLKPDALKPVALLSPFQPMEQVYRPDMVLGSKLSWHNDLVSDQPDDERFEEAVRYMRFAGWHEVGHAVASARGHDDAFAPLVGPADDDDWPDNVAHMASRHADEQYADGYALRQMGSEDPDMGLVAALEVADWRAVNTLLGFMTNQDMPAIYSTQPAITAAVRDIATYVAPGGRIDDPGSDVIAAQTRAAVLAGRHHPEDLAELEVKGWKLPDALAKGDEAFAAHLGAMGRDAEGSPVYYLVRNYLGAMNRLLPDEHPMRGPFDQARAAIAGNPQAAIWDRQNPPIEAQVLAASRRLQIIASQPAEPSNENTLPGTVAIPPAMQDVHGPNLLPDRRLFEDEFFASFPNLRLNTMVLDRAVTDSLDNAWAEVLERPDRYRPNGEITAQYLDYLDMAEAESMDAEFGDGDPFARIAMGDAHLMYATIQPFPVNGGMLNPAAMGVGAMPWHQELFALTPKAELDQATLAGWHEFGHILFNDQYFQEHTDARVKAARIPGDLVEDMQLNAEETFADSYAIGLILRPKAATPNSPPIHQDPIDVLRDHVHLRLTGAMTGLTLGAGGIKHLINPHWRDLARDAINAPSNRDHIAIGEAAITHVVDRQPSAAAVTGIIGDFWDLNPDGLDGRGLTPDAFMDRVAKAGGKAGHAFSYVLARDYLDMLSQRLDGDHELRPAIERAQHGAAQNPKAALWDKRFPPVESILNAMRLDRKRALAADNTPAPATRPAPAA